MFYSIFPTEAGWMGVLGGEGGLKRITLPQKSEDDVYKELGNLKGTSFNVRYFAGLAERFRAYFSGIEVDFPDELDFSVATPFRRKVWEVTRGIAYGQTHSYAWVAAQIAKPQAARAVGQALGANPFPVIVPCHRVLASDGSLHGFAGGLDMKAKMLALERAPQKAQPALV